MAKVPINLLYLLFPLFIFLHLYFSPYTKVEESFNIQAIHDILKYGVPSLETPSAVLQLFDHSTFPGAVPRTFVGALVLASTAKPFLWLNTNIPKQFLVRAILGGVNSIALVSYARGVYRSFGHYAAAWFVLLQASQFHVIYYASRTLPNMFAFGMTTIALRSLLPDIASKVNYTHSSKRYRLCLYLLTIAGIVFRSEIAVLLATTTAFHWFQAQIRLGKEIIPAGIAGVFIGVPITVLVDSLFWQQFPLWPELSAFVYNVVSGNAANWGTHPWHFYFSSALPRLFLNPLTYIICIPLACTIPARRQASFSLVIPSLAFIGLLSFQPHKEWRFIIYTIPPLTTAAGLGASYIWAHRTKSLLYRLLAISLVLSTLASFALSTFVLLPISMANYPGAHALKAVHQYANGSKRDITLYMDTLACQTGVTHFLELPRPESTLFVLPGSADGSIPGLRSGASEWHYDRTEDGRIKQDPIFWDRMDYALIEDEDIVLRHAKQGSRWEVVQEILGFGGIRVIKPGDGLTHGESSNAAKANSNGRRTAEYDFIERILVNVARTWAPERSIIMKYVTRGWWLEVKMVPKLKVMENRRL
ncbi:dolichyl-P-Man:Man(7)GlcNAc(2)-PP-dolichol alpha-1,6-mannosyltransferase [Myotisia sp. PD_48]|nr:dolichyl-P-Man:Man(7)GlcNAc(2)-PP-dolichol alpha-1,6-mannosyltransferase [Myotisia sp. PD_48]